MKILFIITSLGVGGAERQVIDLADQFTRQGANVTIAYLTGEASVLPTCPGIRLTGFGISKSIMGFVHGYFALSHLIKEFQPDVVHSHMVHANLLARLVRLTTKISRLICTAHSTNEGGQLRMWAYRLTDSLADVTTNVSTKAVDAFEAKGAVPQGRMLAVANGIDTNRFHRDQETRLAKRKTEGVGAADQVILAVGRFSEAKDYPNLLYAFSKIMIDPGNIHLWIAGGGGLLPDLKKLAADLGVLEYVKFLGIRSDIPALYNAADVFVLSSAWEGFGLVIAEAMASEKVVVATDCGGVKEVLGDCGFLVPPRNSKALAEALKQALMIVCEDARLLGERARQRVINDYSLPKAVETWNAIYSGSQKNDCNI